MQFKTECILHMHACRDEEKFGLFEVTKSRGAGKVWLQTFKSVDDNLYHSSLYCIIILSR